MKRFVVGLACVAGVLAGDVAHAQPAPGTAPPPVAVPPPPPPPTPPVVLPPGVHVVSAQSAVVGGNAAAARERALDEALRQAVDQALTELLGPDVHPDARGVKTIEARARNYVRRYRALEEGEVNGTFTIRVEAEVDETALRRAADKVLWASTVTPSVMPPAQAGPSGVWLVPAGEAGAAPALAAAVNAAGMRAQVGTAGAGADAGAALRAAARASMSEVAFVTTEVADEGAVRGTGKVAVSCSVRARVVAVASGAQIAELATTPRVFGDHDQAARADCLAHAAADLAPRLIPAGASATAPAADLRTVTIDADVVEPAAVAALLRTVRSIGAVSSAELRRIAAGRAEIRVRTRTPAPALALALSRDAGNVIMLSGAEAAGDLVRLRVRLRPAAQPPGSTP